MSTSERLVALYRGDEFIDVGTIGELARRRHVRPETVRGWLAPSYHERMDKDKRIMAYWVEEDEE